MKELKELARGAWIRGLYKSADQLLDAPGDQLRRPGLILGSRV